MSAQQIFPDKRLNTSLADSTRPAIGNHCWPQMLSVLGLTSLNFKNLGGPNNLTQTGLQHSSESQCRGWMIELGRTSTWRKSGGKQVSMCLKCDGHMMLSGFIFSRSPSWNDHFIAQTLWGPWEMSRQDMPQLLTIDADHDSTFISSQKTCWFGSKISMGYGVIISHQLKRFSSILD